MTNDPLHVISSWNSFEFRISIGLYVVFIQKHGIVSCIRTACKQFLYPFDVVTTACLTTTDVGTVQVVTHCVRDEHMWHDLRKGLKSFNSKIVYLSFRSNRGYCAENGKSNAKHNALFSRLILIQALRVTMMTLLGMIWRKNMSQSSFFHVFIVDNNM